MADGIVCREETNCSVLPSVVALVAWVSTWMFASGVDTDAGTAGGMVDNSSKDGNQIYDYKLMGL